MHQQTYRLMFLDETGTTINMTRPHATLCGQLSDP
jgi:hypothetical protein